MGLHMKAYHFNHWLLSLHEFRYLHYSVTLLSRGGTCFWCLLRPWFMTKIHFKRQPTTEFYSIFFLCNYCIVTVPNCPSPILNCITPGHHRKFYQTAVTPCHQIHSLFVPLSWYWTLTLSLYLGGLLMDYLGCNQSF